SYLSQSHCIEYQTAQKKAKSEISRELVESDQKSILSVKIWCLPM
ncbi:MAG: hypothetical protein ACI8RD_000384, partial [Bacillariaceae sp.]